MELDEYPIYKFTLDVEPPVTYHYILGDNEESFDRVANGNTLNEFFDRQITVKIHPLLPLAFNESSIQKKSKLYDGNFNSIFINYIHQLFELSTYN